MTTAVCSELCCDYCGLPVTAPFWQRHRHPAAQRVYCCFGCRFAAAVTQERGESAVPRATLTRLGIAVFFAMNVMVFTMALWTQDVYRAEASALEVALADVFRWAALVLSIPVLLLLGLPLLHNGWQDLRRGVLSTDVLIVVGVLAAYGYSVASVLREQGHVYFEVAATVLVLVTLGRWLEAAGRLQATRALDELEKLLPETVRIVTTTGVREIPLSQACVGDVFRVLPGERIPVDGQLAGQSTDVDEQVLTGESLPVYKQAGDAVLAGTLNLTGPIDVRATAPPGCGSFAALLGQVRNARQMKGHYQRLSDRVTAWFLPAVMGVALAALCWHTQRSGIDQGVLCGLSVLLIACPCALGLATPLAVWMALGRAAQKQVLVRNPEVLERLAAIRAIRFDKTGTLTSGAADVVAFRTGDGAAALRIAAQLAAASTHPYSRAVCRFASRSRVMNAEPGVQPVHITERPGRGLEGVIAQWAERVYFGSPRFLQEAGLELPLDLLPPPGEPSGSLVAVGWCGRVRGVFVLREQPRPQAAAAIAACRQLGLDVGVLSGDQTARAERLAAVLGVPVRGELRPEGKAVELRAVQSRFGTVGMVGDGINDAPALAAADVGIALGCGADVSRETADVCLQADDLNQVAWSIRLARRTVGVIRQNLGWAFGYNVLGVALAAAGQLNPIVAAVLMMGSSLFVVTNSLRLSRFDASQAHPTPTEAVVDSPPLQIPLISESPSQPGSRLAAAKA